MKPKRPQKMLNDNFINKYAEKIFLNHKNFYNIINIYEIIINILLNFIILNLKI